MCGTNTMQPQACAAGGVCTVNGRRSDGGCCIAESRCGCGCAQVRLNLHRDMDNVLHTLSARECGILRCRYGLDDDRPRTLEEVGHIFNVSRAPTPPLLLLVPKRSILLVLPRSVPRAQRVA